MSQTILLDTTSVKRVTLPAPLGCEALVYIDTIKVWIPRPLNLAPNKKPPLLYQLWRANRGRLIARDGGKRPDGGPRGWSVTLHQPQPEALDLLARRKLNRVDVALDMDQQAARRIVHHGVQKWRGNRKVHQHENTTYWAQTPKTARNLVHYEDKSSKVTGKPCGHLEFRFSTLRATQAAGLDDPAAVLHVDIVALVTHQIKLLHLGEAWKKEERKLAGRIRQKRLRRRRKANPDITEWKRQHLPERYHDHDWSIDSIVEQQNELRRCLCQRLAQSENHTPHFATHDDIPMQVLVDHLPDKLRSKVESL